MRDRFFSAQNINFLLFETHRIQDFSAHEYYREYDKDTIDIMLSTAARVAIRLMRPYLKEMDKNTPEFNGDSVTVHPAVKDFLGQCGNIGFHSSCIPFVRGGHQVPYTAAAACAFIFSSANASLALYSMLTAVTADIISSIGSEELKKYFLPHLFSGRWQGTFAFTEPEAGSSLPDIKAKAIPTGEGYYLIRGKKVFISAGAHNGVENVVHLVAARAEGAIPGMHGLTLFAVPELRGDGMGGLVSNDVTCTGIENKHGYRGVPAVQLSLGDSGNCFGWSLGDEKNGYDYILRVLKMLRLDSAAASTGIASAAYYESLGFAMEREQGRSPEDAKSGIGRCRIIDHADIRRMLFAQKSVYEGSLSLVFQTSVYKDLINVSSADDRGKYAVLSDFLTSLVKSCAAACGNMSAGCAMQVMGGYGYSEDFNAGQYSRDLRMHSVYTGTAGVIAREFLSGIISAENALEFEFFIAEIKSVIDESMDSELLSVYGGRLGESVDALQETADHLRMNSSSKGLEVYYADAVLFMEMAGVVALAWQWLLMALRAEQQSVMTADKNLLSFYASKVHTMKYFYKYELPRAYLLSEILSDSEILTTGSDASVFTD